MTEVRHIIDGSEVASVTGKKFVTLNPATEEPLAEVCEGGPEDVDRAVQTARRAFDEGPWKTMPPWERGRLLGRVAEIIRKRNDDLAMMDALDCGKPLKDNKYGDVPLCAASLIITPASRINSAARFFPQSNSFTTIRSANLTVSSPGSFRGTIHFLTPASSSLLRSPQATPWL